MFIVPFRLREPLSYEEINAIRYHLFPEVRISAEFKAPVPYQDQLLLSLHDIKTMDLHQENLAKQIGDKNRLIQRCCRKWEDTYSSKSCKIAFKRTSGLENLDSLLQYFPCQWNSANGDPYVE